MVGLAVDRDHGAGWHGPVALDAQPPEAHRQEGITLIGARLDVRSARPASSAKGDSSTSIATSLRQARVTRRNIGPYSTPARVAAS
jgi:hypothetical protein